MIRACSEADFPTVLEIVNDSSVAYRGVIPEDRCKTPYMDRDELEGEFRAGVQFWALEEGGRLLGVMGIQRVKDVTLIRHAYVRTLDRGKGVGERLLGHLLALARPPVLCGTWAAAKWAVRFYEKNGFRLVSPAEKDRLLRKYWTIPDRQVETSVVLEYF